MVCENPEVAHLSVLLHLNVLNNKSLLAQFVTDCDGLT